MKALTFFSLLLMFAFSCAPKPQQESTSLETTPEAPKKETLIGFQSIIEDADVTGTILVYDPQKQTYYSNNFERCDQGFLPASTYKIPNSIIALETGVVEDDSTLFKWDGEKRNMKIWEQDLIFHQAFHYSCVPCYQQIARAIGPNRMNAYLEKMDYPGMIVDSSSIDLFWLQGPSRITPNQQMDFIKRFYFSKLPIQARTENIMKALMVIEEKEAYKISGKTGWSIREGFNIGWFVAYLEKGGNVYFLVTNVEPNESFDMSLFAKIRKDIAMEALKSLEIIE